MGRILLSTSREDRARNYVEALKAVGVDAADILVSSPDQLPHNPDSSTDLARDVAGIVLSGGDDVAPHRYGEREIAGSLVRASPARDDLEFSLLDGAHRERVPVFGVCRGLQVLNVYLRGTLWQDLPSQRPSVVAHEVNSPLDRLAHTAVGSGSDHPHPFARCVSLALQENPSVNSRHHQAVKDLAPGLEVAATAADGLIEAFVMRHPEDWWVGAVQWHPENLIALEPQRELWRAFVERTRK